jgi:hypothetical protein
VLQIRQAAVKELLKGCVVVALVFGSCADALKIDLTLENGLTLRRHFKTVEV